MCVLEILDKGIKSESIIKNEKKKQKYQLRLDKTKIK